MLGEWGGSIAYLCVVRSWYLHMHVLFASFLLAQEGSEDEQDEARAMHRPRLLRRPPSPLPRRSREASPPRHLAPPVPTTAYLGEPSPPR